MRTVARRAYAILLMLLTAASGQEHTSQPVPCLRLEREIPLSGVAGRIDHLSADIAGRRIFVAELGNGTVEAIDLNHGQSLGRIQGLEEPQGVAFVPTNGRLYVATGGDGFVRSFDLASWRALDIIKLGTDADNLRYDASHQQVLAGYGEGAIAVLGLNLTRLEEFKLPAHPESFQMTSDGRRILVNLPDNHSVASINYENHSVNPAWTRPGPLANFPMALDSENDRLFIACRRPARIAQMNATTGQVVGEMGTVGDADDLFYDRTLRQVYAIGGEGYVDVVDAQPGKPLAWLGHVATAPGARTGLYIPEWNQLVVAAPQRGHQNARLLIFSVSHP